MGPRLSRGRSRLCHRIGPVMSPMEATGSHAWKQQVKGIGHLPGLHICRFISHSRGQLKGFCNMLEPQSPVLPGSLLV